MVVPTKRKPCFFSASLMQPDGVLAGTSRLSCRWLRSGLPSTNGYR